MLEEIFVEYFASYQYLIVTSSGALKSHSPSLFPSRVFWVGVHLIVGYISEIISYANSSNFFTIDFTPINHHHSPIIKSYPVF